jgi:phage shock protein E
MKKLCMSLLLAVTTLWAASLLAEVSADAVWIDVRSASEFAGDHMEGAVNIPWDGIEKGVAEMGLTTDTPIYLYCAKGGRAGKAQETLAAAGYKTTVNAGGLEQARELAASK